MITFLLTFKLGVQSQRDSFPNQNYSLYKGKKNKETKTMEEFNVH